MMFLYVARMLFQQTMDRIVGTNHSERLRRSDAVNNDVVVVPWDAWM
jgi:hypothetical protein